jgi:hypothetical protein
VPNGFPAIADEIIAKHADVVLFSEVRNYKGTDFIQRILTELKAKGAIYFGQSSDAKLDVGFISKYPIESQHALYEKDSTMGGVLKVRSRLESVLLYVILYTWTTRIMPAICHVVMMV